MEQSLPIRFRDRVVGTAQLRRQGMYWRVRCDCALPAALRYRVLARCSDGRVDLGLLYPDEDRLTLTTGLPMRAIDPNTAQIEAVACESEVVVLDEGCPLPCIARLEQYRYCVRNGKPCLVTREEII